MVSKFMRKRPYVSVKDSHNFYLCLLQIHMRTKDNDLPECMKVRLVIHNGIVSL